MVKSASRDATRSELIRLLEGLEFYRSWRISSLKRDKGTVTEDDLNQIVVTGSFFLQLFGNTQGSRCVDVLKEVRQWYSHTASDLVRMANSGEESWAAEANKFLKDFQREVGFDFFSEAGLLKRVVDKSLKGRRVASTEDYYILKELENDPAQSVINPEEMAKISDLLREFETKHKSY